ncbi:rust resistance kinase Lr10-like [Cornus florida]|uniref:rust resistance kinase Lr10-like n=1 Tax=Cornus florida TaxID=4283 RepID=UPI00289F1B3B|nr:rust resistance kinase Lr10-like [Cornus florida]
MEAEMAINILFSSFSMLLILVLAKVGGGHALCGVSRCSDYGPAIRFPFKIKDQQPDNQCGYPGFELSCNDNNQTVLELPFSLKVLVKKIDYTSQLIHIYHDYNDPKSCLANLSLPVSPFHFKDYFYPYDFALFNCSAPDRDRGYLVPCLDVPGYHVYAVDSSVEIDYYSLTSCSKIAANISSVPYDFFSQNFRTQLNWSTPNCGKCESQGKICSFKNYTGGYEIQCSEESQGVSSTAMLLIRGSILGPFFLVVVASLLYRFHTMNKMEKENQVKIEKFLEDYRALKPTRYSYADIKKITNQFEEKLGQGGYGTVFKGKLSNEILVAVKVLDNSTGKGEDFINEVGTIGRIHHVNVVRLVGFCADGFKRALVYEFLPNDSLQKFLFTEKQKKHSLSWVKLQNIALGVAKGIEYLHQGCDQRILHFDIKPHNILLDHNFNPKVSDFGLAKLCSKEKSAVSMTAARGTVGYIAPEVFSRNFGNVSYKSDVYSFGMLLLDMVGVRKKGDVTVEDSSQTYFPEWIYNRLREGEELGMHIEEEEDAKIAKKLTIVGLWCIQWYPVDRPAMNIVVQMLEGEGDGLTMPPSPFASTAQMNRTTMPARAFEIELEVISEVE